MFLEVKDDSAKIVEPGDPRKKSFESSHLEVRTFNVGHGEAILVVFDNGRTWLLDCGSNSERRNRLLAEQLIAYLKDSGLVLDTIIASHPHFDHAGAIETIVAAAPEHVASPLTIYRTEVKEWHSAKGWRSRYRDAINAASRQIIEIAIKDTHREVIVAEGVEAHLFVGSGENFYTSIFVQIRYHDARLLFTGDAECGYENDLLEAFGPEDFLSDVLKVTHHGSSSGTAKKALKQIRPGIAVASTGDDPRHRLEKDTLARLGGRPGPRAVFETVVDGDIILKTDGKKFEGGVLYQAEFEPPGLFAAKIGGDIVSLEAVNRERTESPHSDCEACE